MRIALDLHGIINAHPEFFSELSKLFVNANHEVHILTGSHIKEQGIKEQLDKYGISYTHLFSIADHHRDNKTEGMWYDEKGDPWVSEEQWNRTKATYCKEHEISFCIDDTPRYANYFETPFGYMSIQMHKQQPNKYLGFIIDTFEKRRRKTLWNKIESWINKNLGWFLSPPYKQGKKNQNKKYK